MTELAITSAFIAVVSVATTICLLRQQSKLKKRHNYIIEQNVRLEAEKSEALRSSVASRAEARRERDRLVAEFKADYLAKFKADNANIVSQALAKPSSDQLVAAIRQLIEQKSSRIQQDFIGTVEDEAEAIIRDLNMELCEKIWDAFQGYKEISKETPYIFPDGTKIAYTKGNRTVIVIEQKPQVRSVTFDRELVANRTIADQAQSKTATGYRYSLSFPYVYFVVVFDKSEYSFHELYFRNGPLTSIREYISLAPLPNVWRKEDRADKSVCMGGDFRGANSDETTVARKADMVVADFWQRTFSSDLGTGAPDKVDKRIRNYAVWQEHSLKDPLFVLNIKWTKGKTIKGVVESLLDNRDRSDKLDASDKVIRTRLEEGVAKLTGKLKEEIVRAKQEGLKDCNLDEQAVSLLTNTLVQHTEAVFSKL
jgi:hypothetical protein